jgi:formylglycine-generating enzyme required for sulfatase activity
LTFEIEGIATQTTFDLSTGQLADAGTGGIGGVLAPITPLTNDSVKAEAIVLPVKDINASKISLRIKIRGKDYAATLPPASGSTAIEAGKRYTYTILLDLNVITISGTLDPWDNVEGDPPSFNEVPSPPPPTFTLEQVLISKGTFQMGSPPTEPGRAANETLHEVTLTQDFNMSKYETTNEQYAEFLNAFHIGATGMGNVDGFGSQRLVEPFAEWGVVWNGSTWQSASGKEKHPAGSVTWYGAKAFADWVGGSLPTEAQWEYACRAGTQTAYSFGADASDLGDYAWFGGNSGNTTHPVGQKLPNPWGLYDMHGNVWELCSDWYGDYGSAAVTNPVGPATGTRRVEHGGGLSSPATNCGSARRGEVSPSVNNYGIGFRVIFVVP